MNRKKIKTFVTACALIGVLSVGGIMAYFTDGDTATNTFTVGKISIDLQEPNWNEEAGKDLIPLKEIAKDPQVKNDGINELYTFIEVVVPYANVRVASQDGMVVEKADTELFSYDVNDGWVEVGTPKKDADTGTVTHLYAYGTDAEMTVLDKDATTPTLFDHVRFADIVEDEGLEEVNVDIVINAYAIQTTNINDGKTDIDGDNEDGKTAPDAVWEVLSKQTPSTIVDEAEDANTDIKQ